MKTLRYLYDLEFLEDGKRIWPISIGIVCEDGREYYAVNSGMPDHLVGAHDWLCKNVVPHLPIVGRGIILEIIEEAKGKGTTFNDDNPLPFMIDVSDPCVQPRFVIAKEVERFLLPTDEAGNITSTPELWAYCCAYDHVALCQLWGSMVDTPEGIPHYTNDLASLRRQLGNPAVPHQPKEEAHHALWDAQYNAKVYWYLVDLASGTADGIAL